MEEISIARLKPEDMARLRKRLCDLKLASSLEGLYWLPAPAAMLNAMQAAHRESCGPYFLALDTNPDSGELTLEPLVRAGNSLHCACIAEATPEILKHMTEYLEGLLRELSINCLNLERQCQA